MASTNWYVDPVSGSDSNGGTSDGDAWATIQYALNNITPTTTDSDFLNLKTSGTHTLTANMSWAGHTFNVAYPMCIRGYTSTAGDGGIPTIECDGYTFINSSSYHHFMMQGLKFQNTGTGVNNAFTTGYNILYKNCEWNNFDTGGATNTLIASSSGVAQKLSIINCTFTDINGYCINSASSNVNIESCHFYNSGAKTINVCYYINGTLKPVIAGNIFNLTSTSKGIYATSTDGIYARGNTFFTSGAGTAIEKPSYNYGSIIEDNIFEGWGKAIDFENLASYMGHSLSNNHFYDNTTDVDTTTNKTFMINDGNFLSASGTVLAKSGSNTHANRATYFAPTGDAIGGAADGIHDIGAMPAIASGGGGGLITAGRMTGGMQ